MAKRWNRTETWVALIALGIGGIILAIFGLYVYMSATATPLHPEAASVPSSAERDASREWAAAVERGREIMRTGLVEHNLPGISIAVGVGDDIVWAEAFGFANLDARSPLTPDHRFRIGTASKMLTSAAVGLLLERGQLELDQDIHTYVAEFPRKQWPVTLRHVLAHTAGIGTDSGDEGPFYGQACERPADALQEFADADLRFEPGTQYRYSNYGWILVSAAIEAVIKKRLMTFMRDEIFDPLGMSDTRDDSLTKDIPDRVTPYFPRFAADPRYGPDPMRDIELSCYSGSAGFLSTPTDLVRFGLAIDSGTLLQPETVELLQTSQRLRSGEETGYGLGWHLETVTLLGQPAPIVGYDGEVLGGVNGSLILLRDRHLVIAVISNTSYADTPSLALKVAEVFAQAQTGAAAR